MSHAGAETTSSPGPGRGRGASRGRPGRGRGRGRGSFRFPGSKSLDSNDPSASSLEHSAATSALQGQTSEGDAKRKPIRRADARRGSTNATAPETAVDSSAPRSVARLHELPPHIAGAAVDAESLVSRVRELAISGHAHTSSMESRFTMSLNWADEEDDPDSLPDLDDWAPKPKTSLPEPVAPQEPQPEAVVQDSEPVAEQLSAIEAPASATAKEPTPVAAEVPLQPPKGDSVDTSVAPNAEVSTVTKKPRAGLEASMWASSTPETTNHIPHPPPKERRSRQNNSRGSASISRLSDLPFHPLNLSRGSESNGATHNQSEERARQPEPRPSPRKPHARPVISTDAISRLSRTLGRDALRTQQSTTT